ncbi:MAG: signal peptide peptidase SppA, partial [Duncaniella sp.]|nr:signal peptide peptidase SppA [Duncaniella sp.]
TLRGERSATLGVNEIVGAIREAASDDKIDGIVLQCVGSAAGLAQRQAIREALQQFKKSAPDKWIYAYGDTYLQGDYYIASVADSIYLNPIGQIFISGLTSTNLYFKGLLDKLGIEMQVVKVGTYKSAVEPFTLSSMSEPAREQMSVLLDDMWQPIAASIAEARRVPLDSVTAWAKDGSFAFASADYVSRGIADRLVYRHQFDEILAKATRQDSADDLNPVSVPNYCKTCDIDRFGSGRGRDVTIGVLYAVGDITDSEGDGIVASRLVPQILDLAEDDDLDGLVMVVNSGGGSAYASEQIWEALQQWKKLTGKPFYVSMSDYAASGGYYISCGADRIYAQPTTLTGSIGIFGLIPDFHGLMADKLGVTTSTVTSVDGVQFPNTLSPMTPAQRQAMQSYVDRGYELFTARCAEGRHMSQDSIKAIAEGRVWAGDRALKLGLVDEIGGLDKAVRGMASKLGAKSWRVVSYPAPRKWYDELIELTEDFQSSLVKRELGELTPLYEASRQVTTMAPVQARMDHFTIDL